MAQHDGFWKLEHLSDAQLLESLGGVLRSQRRTLAELVAHLAEVEDRRLHLEAAYSSMFAYCVERLAMSEDEACRRIELARLARKFPALFPELARGQITLSVALVLKPVLSASNHIELLSAARGKCIRQARELVAEHFPKADAPSSIRKLPERRGLEAAAPVQASLPGPASLLASIPAAPPQPAPPQLAVGAASSAPASMPQPAPPQLAPPEPSLPPPALGGATSMPQSSPPMPSLPQPSLPPPTLGGAASIPRPSPPMPCLPWSPREPALPSPEVERQAHAPAPGGGSPRVSRSSIEPLSARRYRVQFTADLELKRKLERARDLLRHAHPDGDFGPIVSRALDLLLDDVLRRRFGAGARRKGPSPASETAASTPPPSGGHSNTSTPASSAPQAPVSSAPASSALPAPGGAALASSAPASSAPQAPASSAPQASASSAPQASASSAPQASASSAPQARASSATASSAPQALASSATASSAPQATASETDRPANAPAVATAAMPRSVPRPRPHVSRAARRAVLERDGLGCSWVDDHGVRCGSDAWLQFDHCQPAGKAGSSEPDNLRLLCRAHNVLAAEHAYGREHMARAATRRRRTKHSLDPRA